MLDPKFIRGNVDLVKRNQTRRGSDPQAVDEFCGVDTKVRETKQQVDKLRQEKNVVTENINVKRKAGEDFRADIALMRDLNATLKEAETLYETLTAQRETLLSSFGNICTRTCRWGKMIVKMLNFAVKVIVQNVSIIHTLTFLISLGTQTLLRPRKRLVTDFII